MTKDRPILFSGAMVRAILDGRKNSDPADHQAAALEVTGMRVEQLNDCSKADAIAEGIVPDLEGWTDYSNPSCQMCMRPLDSYRVLWGSINGAGAWQANPWVWVVEFRRVQR